MPVIAVLIALLLAGPARAEPEVQALFQAGQDPLGKALRYPDLAAEISAQIVTLEPGDSTGWHLHAVPTFGYVLTGQLTVDYADGQVREFSAGEGIVEAQLTPHIGHNAGNETVRVLAFHAGAPGVAVTEAAEPGRPDSFVDLLSVIPDLTVELRYFGSNNFIGRPITGYESGTAYLTREAALALSAVQADLASDGYALKVFDAYRPQRAVSDFLRWAQDPNDTAMRQAFYPTVAKERLIPEGYIAARSGHSRGSTVDLTLIRISDGEEVDMGSPYDLFDPVSWPASTAVSAEARANRLRLRNAMLARGFVPLDLEWWHFTLADEPYPNRYFDFPIR